MTTHTAATTRRLLALAALLSLLAAACGEDGAGTDTTDSTAPADTAPGDIDTGPADTAPGDIDTGPADTAPGDVGGDTGPADSAPGDIGGDTGPADTAPGDVGDDTGPADTAPADTGGVDTAPGDTAPSDVDAPAPVMATAGARCPLTARVGLVELELQGATVYASATIFDRPNPWYGPPELTSEACAFFRYAPTAGCDPCQDGEVCSLDGACVPAQAARGDTALVASVGGETQAIGRSGDMLWGALTLPGTTFALALSFGAVEVRVPETGIPGELTDLDGLLAGGYDAPTGLDISWTAPQDAGDVTTEIPINHHAGGPTFTACRVPAVDGAFHVGEAMLAPLAVATGLEFQGVDHVRFLAAETPLGCVEFRFLRRYYPGFVHDAR